MNNTYSRRDFLKTGAMGTGAVLTSRVINIDIEDKSQGVAEQTAPAEINFGIIGVGMQGSGLLGNAISLPGVKCVAAADLYDGRHTLAREITGNQSLYTTRDYRELLKRKDIDCIIAAVPDHWHKRLVIEACEAGKDVYCEKPMSHTIAEGFAMVEAAKKYNRIVQIGSQRVSSGLCRKAREMYTGGAIGEVEHIELTLGRNDPSGAWQYPVPQDLSLKTVDWDTWLNDTPKIPLNGEIFARWRCWKQYGTGVAGDLMVHLLSGMMFSLGWNEIPRSASSLGGIFRWKDGRDMPDTHLVLFDYHGVPVFVRLGLGTETPESLRYYGPKGYMEAGGYTLKFIGQPGIDTYPSYYDYSFPSKLKAEYESKWYAENAPQPGQEPVYEEVLYKGHDWDDVKPHLKNFFSAVKSRKPVVEDAVFGNNAAVACHMANEAFFRGKTVYWDEASKNIRT
ncbi:MAG: Gfo/Idh/MocA family oxidoreductase [Bacteroidales bacterium]